ncbi:MAG: hypothetical protein J7521_20230 [Caulobacter sp.]|nr:hypothetical protein [Caulobacter sp.]
MKAITILAIVATVAIGGCATKRYPIATPLGMSEASMLTCHDIELELTRAEEARRQISDTAKIDWRSAAGFLGDFGIGNAMAKSDAERAINNRVVALNDAKTKKNCQAPQASLADRIGRALGMM